MTTIEDSMEARLKRVETKVDGLKIQFEKVSEDIKKLGEGYEQGLQSISNQIKDHAKRIAALEPLEPR